MATMHYTIPAESMNETIYVYILELAYRDERRRRYYVGQTSNVLRRFLEHALGYGCKKTITFGVKRLIAVRTFSSRAEAKSYEQYCQRMITAGREPIDSCCSFPLPSSVIDLSFTTTRLRSWKRNIKRGLYRQSFGSKLAESIL